MSWQSATPVKPIARSRRPNKNSAAPGPLRIGNGSLALPLSRSRGRRSPTGLANGGWKVFWIYWDTAWSLIISGIMFATIVAHPDAEFVEVQAAKRAK